MTTNDAKRSDANYTESSEANYTSTPPPAPPIRGRDRHPTQQFINKFLFFLMIMNDHQ